MVHQIWDTIEEGERGEDPEIGPYIKVPKVLIRKRKELNGYFRYTQCNS